MFHMHTRLLLVLLVLGYSVSAADIVASRETLVAQVGQEGQAGQDRPQRSRSGTGDFAKEALNLVETERQSPSTAQNAQERFNRLTRVVSLLIQAGGPPREILTKEEADAVGSLLQHGNAEEAARRVHDSILKLERAVAGQGSSRSFMPSLDSGGAQKQPREMMRMPQAISGDAASSAAVKKINVGQMANKNSFGNILKLLNPAIDSARRRLYVCGAKSTVVGVVDIDKDTLIETFDIGITGGYLVVDPASGLLYSLEIGGANRIYRIDVKQKTAEEVSSLPSGLSIPQRRGRKAQATKTYKGLSYTDTGYPFEAGYLQNENASYGIIEIRDANGSDAGRIKHGPDALYFDIDQKTDKLYATNTGDGSITVFDLNNNNRKMKDIDVGTSVDEILLDPRSGGLYLRNRLGGSTIFFYDKNTGDLTTIPNENIAGTRGIGLWPTGMIYDGGRLYVLGHYAGRIDVVDTATNTVVGHIPLNLSQKPRTDGISALTMNRKSKVLYAAFPELGELALADAKTMKPIKTLTIDGFDKAKLGPARIALAVDEKHDRLFVYLSEERMLQVYKGRDCLLKATAPLDAGRIGNVISYNADKDIVYLGKKILDAETLKEIGAFSQGDRIVAFDAATDRVYLSSAIHLGPAKMIEKVYEFKAMILTQEWTLSPIISIPSSFAFDFSNNKFYVGYFEPAVVEEFDLARGKAPSAAGPSSQGGN